MYINNSIIGFTKYTIHSTVYKQKIGKSNIYVVEPNRNICKSCYLEGLPHYLRQEPRTI